MPRPDFFDFMTITLGLSFGLDIGPDDFTPEAIAEREARRRAVKAGDLTDADWSDIERSIDAMEPDGSTPRPGP